MTDNKPQKTFLANPKLRLTAPCPTAKGKYSNLSFDLWNSNPRIVVTTNDPNLINQENNYGRITAALDAPTMGVFIELLKQVTESPVPIKDKIENYGIQKGGDPKSPVHLTDLWVGKDDSGIVFISVVNKQEGWPIIKFVFSASDIRFHKFYHGDGSEFTMSEYSKVYAKAYINTLTGVYNNLYVRDYVHQVGKKPYQNNNNQRSNHPAEDISSGDIPW